MPKERVYKKGEPGSEYDKFQASPKAKKDRAARNKAHRELDPPKGMEVDHIQALKNGGSRGKGNLRVVTRAANRKKGAK